MRRRTRWHDTLESRTSGRARRWSRLFRRKADRLFFRTRVRSVCDLDVQKRGRWFVLKGHVDSFGTKVRLISMVPLGPDGKKRVIDKLRVQS